MSGSYDISSLLNFDVDQLIKETSGGYENVIYKVNLVKEQLSTYDAIIKFIPWYKAPNDSIVEKWAVFLKNPINDEMKFVDCPSTIMKEKSLLQDAFFACRESDKANIRDLQDRFKRTKQYFSLIQIIEDKQHPELVGKIKVFQYGLQIYDKIKANIKPTSEYKQGSNPFDLFDGKLFNLFVKMKTESKTQKFPDYTQSEFFDKKSGLLIDGKEMTKKDGQAIMKYLEANSPDLDSYRFKPWDETTQKFVAESITSIIPPGKVIDDLTKKWKGIFSLVDDIEEENEPRYKKQEQKAKPIKKEQIPDDDEDEDEIIDTEDDADNLDDLDDFVNSRKKEVKKETKPTRRKIDDFEEFDI